MEPVNEPHNITKRDIQNPLVISSKIESSTTQSTFRPSEISLTDSDWETTTMEWETTTDPPAENIDTKKPKKVALPIQEIKRDQKNYRLFIKMKNRLEKGKSYTIDVEFSGVILNNLIGLYKTSYVDLEGNTKSVFK